MAEEGPKRRAELGDTAKAMQGAAPWVSAVWKLVGGAVVGVLGGYFVDRWLGIGPWGTVGLSVLGIGVGFYGFIHTVLQLQKSGQK